MKSPLSLFIALLLLLVSCSGENAPVEKTAQQKTKAPETTRQNPGTAPEKAASPKRGSAKAPENKKTNVATPAPSVSSEERVQHLKTKVQEGQPLFIHAFVPLCDNEHQGIVKVNASLGDGMSTRTNLYWGAGYGIKTHFSRLAGWKRISLVANPSANVLERAVFVKKYPGGATVYLVADAYRGDRMQECLDDYFAACTNWSDANSIVVNEKSVGINAGADLLVFNGHNGLMDLDVQVVASRRKEPADAAVIGCASYSYFTPLLAKSGVYPLLTTSGLMAPEAYVLEAVVDAWAQLQGGMEVRNAAGDAYNRVQKCGQKAGRNLFRTGY